jgi:hypothetical protein
MIFRGSIPNPMQSLCTLRNHCRQRPRNTRYQADATPYLDRTFTGWIAPALCWRTYSITSSARSRNDSEIVRPIAFAAIALMTNSSLVGCSAGSSAGFAPRRTLSTSSAARRKRSPHSPYHSIKQACERSEKRVQRCRSNPRSTCGTAHSSRRFSSKDRQRHRIRRRHPY